MIFNDNKAIYLQIADKIKDEIMSRKYVAEQRVPSVREYAAEVEVNANTVMRAFELLDREGIIYNRRGIGFFVSSFAIEKIMNKRKEIFFKEEFPYFLTRLKSFGISPEELAENYQSYLNNLRNENHN